MVQKEPRPRGRPRSFDPDQALRKARDAFWNAGYSATSLDDLAQATGLNRPSLYAAFGDKRALYLAALDRSRAEMTASLSAAAAAPGSLAEGLRRIYAAASAVYRAGEAGQRGCFLIGTAVTESVADPEVRRILAQGLGEIDRAFLAMLERGRDAGELAAGLDPQAAAAVCGATLHTLAIRARSGASEAELAAVAEGLIAMVCRPGG